MTVAERILDELRKAGGPLTAAALARLVLPHMPAGAGANQAGAYLRRLKAAGLVSDRPGPKPPGRGRRPHLWELAASDGGDVRRESGRGLRAGKSGGALARGGACGSVRIPTGCGLLPDGVWLAVVPVLHPETEPEAIREAQRRDVAAHLEAHPGATAAEIAEAVVLPLWNVERAVAELRGVPAPEPVARQTWRTAGRTKDGRRAVVRRKAVAA